ASSPFFVNTHLRDWLPRAGTPRRAGVSSFGIGGTNAHVIVEEPAMGPPSEALRSANLLLLSARTEAALQQSTEHLAAHLEREHHLNPADAAYTLAAGRASFEYRRAVVCRESGDAITALHTLDPNCVVTG